LKPHEVWTVFLIELQDMADVSITEKIDK
jgi:hypothetical protein